MPQGQTLNPPLSHNVKTDRGFHHERTSTLLCPAGLDWENNEYDLHFIFLPPLTRSRVKDKLKTGELMVSSDQWPIFLYHGYTYDPEDP